MTQYNCSVRAHSRHHLELKSEYPLKGDSRKSSYKMDLYFFIPAQLNVNARRVGVKKLIDNIKIYTRFSTPKMSLPALGDKNNPLSPLYRIHKILEEPENIRQKTGRDPLLYEMQVLTNIYRAEVETTVDLADTAYCSQNPEHIYRKKVDMFLTEITLFLKDFRKLHTLFLSPRVTDYHRTVLAWADEAVSIITERSLNKLFSLVSEFDKPDKRIAEIEKIVEKETAYRESMDYPYLFNDEIPNIGEILAYRENVLKKWAQSAMYLTREESGSQKRIGHIVAGAAAGIAMLFAVFVTIFAGRIFIPNTTPWILAVIVSYIFKDRIKEILRDSFKKSLPQFTSDQMSLFFDPSIDRKVGSARSYASFSKASQAPTGILQIRNAESNPFRSILPEQDLLHYQRIIDLNSRQLDQNHSRLTSATEIIRVHIADWLREMDNPKDVFYRLENMTKIKIKGNRVYRIHLIIRLGDELYHYLIILNKTGILRVEELNELIAP